MTAAVLVLLVVALVSACSEPGNKPTPDGTVAIAIQVKGMMCDSCEAAIRNAVTGAGAIKVVKCEFETGSLVVEAPASARPAIIAAIRTIGYDIVESNSGSENASDHTAPQTE